MDVEDVVLVVTVMTTLAGFSMWIGMSIAKVVGRQRIAENVLRERLALTWGRAQPAAPPEQKG